MKRVLLVEDNPGDARLLREMLREDRTHGVTLSQTGTMDEAEAALAANSFDLVLLDLGLPGETGLSALRRAKAAAPRVPLVVFTASDDETLALLALQEGAEDYLVKGQTDARGLMRALRYAIERKAATEALFAETERAQVTLDSIGDAVVSTDINGKITFLNKVAETMTGWTRSEATGRPMTDICRIVDPGSTLTPLNRLVTAIAGGRPIHSLPTSVLVRRDGFETPVEDSQSPIHDRMGKVAGGVLVLRDVSTTRAMARQMTHSAEHDFLTGLPNRMLLNDRIGQAINRARRQRHAVAVLFLDLDGFKHINDSLGHPTGDKLLRSVAARLVASVREADTVSRQGGDEFIVLLSDVESAESAGNMARRLLEAVSEPHAIDPHDLHITASIGVSVYPVDGLDAETLIKNADTAMYQVKAAGRQSYRLFEPSMNVRAVERQSIEASLRRALEREEFALYYQPKIRLDTGDICGAEALIRWTHPSRGVVAPGQFIPIAEDCGLILQIGNWVMVQACQQMRAWLDAGLVVPAIAVNVSAREFLENNFIEKVIDTLTKNRLAPAQLELELTEGVLMNRAAETAQVLQALRRHGVKLAVDDFGTGYSSLSYLQKFPLDVLKIDQSFIRQISTPGEDTAIVTAVIGMARSLGLRVVAEGVETLAELEFLRDRQCDEVQGYYFSRPLPPHDFALLLREGIKPLPRLTPLPRRRKRSTAR
jgi:diguanylate cyclase (GGDEF)-like protein/PAS domain S-box-containing protein